MGSKNGGLDEEPLRFVKISRPLAIGKYEVTFAEWDACVADGDCRRRPRDEDWGRRRRPVVNVSWDEITNEYIPWLRRKSGHDYRLLTEAEWEYAARAGSSTPYTWGHAVPKGQANCNGCGSRWDHRMTAPVGSFTANAFGLHDMHGNVWEWVADCWHNDYRDAPADNRSWTKNCETDFFEKNGLRVVRGGSWLDYPWRIRSAQRYAVQARFRNGNHIGFRVVRPVRK